MTDLNFLGFKWFFFEKKIDFKESISFWHLFSIHQIPVSVLAVLIISTFDIQIKLLIQHEEAKYKFSTFLISQVVFFAF